MKGLMNSFPFFSLCSLGGGTVKIVEPGKSLVPRITA